MTLADKVTSCRIVLAPVFFAMYLLPERFPGWFSGGAGWTVPVLWVIFIVSELTDLFDGRIARRRGEVGDFGKLYDPFADVLVRVTYFLCFVVTRILPVLPLLLILYREFGILFLRMLMLRKGTALGARRGGKLKALLYMGAGGAALAAASLERVGMEVSPLLPARVRVAAVSIFWVSAVVSALSFADYMRVYRKAGTVEEACKKA